MSCEDVVMEAATTVLQWWEDKLEDKDNIRKVVKKLGLWCYPWAVKWASWNVHISGIHMLWNKKCFCCWGYCELCPLLIVAKKILTITYNWEVNKIINIGILRQEIE